MWSCIIFFVIIIDIISADENSIVDRRISFRSVVPRIDDKDLDTVKPNNRDVLWDPFLNDDGDDNRIPRLPFIDHPSIVFTPSSLSFSGEGCNCNDHSDCYPQNGTCIACRDNTTGTSCDLCLPGFIGDPLIGNCNMEVIDTSTNNTSTGFVYLGESSSTSSSSSSSFWSTAPGIVSLVFVGSIPLFCLVAIKNYKQCCRSRVNDDGHEVELFSIDSVHSS